MDKFSYLSNGHGDAIEDSYKQYLNDPEPVEPGWRSFFEGFEFARKNYDTPMWFPTISQRSFRW
jgi:2-oxoglutarate dehydrogenase E1 component